MVITSVFRTKKCVSSLHAVIIVGACAVVARATKHDIVYGHHPWAGCCLWISFGYNIYDLCSMHVVFKEQNSCGALKGLSSLQRIKLFCYARAAMVAHHVLILVGILIFEPLRTGRGDFVIACMNLMEFSTPFVSCRAILSELQMKQSKLYAANGLAMIFAFFICRIVLFPYIFLCYARFVNIPFFSVFATIPRKCIIASSIIFLLQFYWFCLIVLGAFKHFAKKNDSTSKKDD